jgi:prepilin-type N-terminal cleavage/methylation domain-containing protein
MPSANNRQFKIQKAFTLIELLVVIAIVGILAGLAVVNMSGATEAARIAKLKVYSNSIRSSLMGNRVSEWKFDEGAGTSTADTVGNNSGDLTGHLPTWKIGTGCVSGNCLSFDGSDDYIGFGDKDLDYTEFTIELWTKSFSASQAHVTNLIGKGDWNQTNNWYLGYKSASHLSFVYGVGWGSGPSYPISSFDLTRWHHMVGVATANQLKLYLDGVLANSTTISHGSVSNDYELQIARSSYYGERYDGLIDEVRIYSAAMTASAVREDYLSGLDKLLVNGQITNEDYQQRLADLNSTYAVNK